MKQDPTIYGLMAEFETPGELRAAAAAAHALGYTHMDGFTPFPVEGLPHALGRRRPLIPLITLMGGILGGSGAYFMEWYANVISYPLNIGGRPLNSWPSFVPIVFELTVLGAALSAFFGTIVMNKLPQPYHPVFNASHFERASIDRFFLCIESSDPKFDSAATRSFLHGLNPANISEVQR